MSTKRAKPPSTDRGAEKVARFGRRVDWCEFTLWGLYAEEIERVIDGYVPGGFIDGPGAFYGYRHQRVGPGTARVLSDPERPEVHVILPGKWCGAVDEAGMRGLLLWIDSHGGTPTRLDLAIDDFERRVTPHDVRDAIKRGEIVTHTEKAWFHETLMGEDGTTVYVGARSSRVMLRVYDKGIQSKGKLDAIRWELMLRKEAAAAIQRELAVKDWASLFGAQLLRLADFKERTAHSKLKKCPQLAWYLEIVGDVEKARPYMPEPVYSAAKSMDHFQRNQAPTLAALVANQEGDVGFIYAALNEGRKRWKPKHRLIAGDRD